MRVSQIEELNTIDSTITNLHQNLYDLYNRRANIVGAPKSNKSSDDSIDLSSIDLSLTDSRASLGLGRKHVAARK